VGLASSAHADVYAALENAELAAVVDIRPEKRQEAAEKYGAATYESLEPVLEDASIQVVDCCLPTFLHRDCVVACLEAGKDVLCEKPITLDPSDADDILDAVKRTGRKFMTAQVIRFWPEYVVTKQVIDSGALGAPLAALAHRYVPAPDWSWDDWLLDAERSGGAVIDNHIHDLDYLNWVFGKPTKVYARGLQSERGAVDHVFTTLGYENGRMAFAESGFFTPAGTGLVMSLKVICEEGCIHLSNITEPTLTVQRPNADPEHPSLPEDDGYVAEIKYFLDCVERDVMPETVTPEDAKLALQVADAARLSALGGGEVVTI